MNTQYYENDWTDHLKMNEQNGTELSISWDANNSEDVE